jgi:hypothetical protein
MLKTYRLVAYELGTDREVLNWPDVAPTRRFQRGDIIKDGNAAWEVVGVRDTSTESLWLVDVRKVLAGDCG